jgi:hypothetical protein
MAALLDLGRVQRRAGQRELLRVVYGEEGPPEGLDIETATDTLYAIGSPETFRLLVHDRGWTGDEFERWYAETLDRLLLRGAVAEPPIG